MESDKPSRGRGPRDDAEERYSGRSSIFDRLDKGGDDQKQEERSKAPSASETPVEGPIQCTSCSLSYACLSGLCELDCLMNSCGRMGDLCSWFEPRGVRGGHH